MSAYGHPRTRKRRFAASGVMHVLALLVALLLPLHGVANAFSSIESPAHYHLPALLLVQGDVVIGQIGHIDSGHRAHQSDHDPVGDSRDHDAAVDHHDHAHGNIHGHDAMVETHDDHGHQGQVTTTVGQHAHAFDAGDVVYLAGDSDPADEGTAGKHVATSGDATLPAWSMPLLAVLGEQMLPKPASAFRSHRARLLLRPPSCMVAHAA